VTSTIGPRELGDLAAAGAFNRTIYRELDPAARAWLDGGDPRPLLRLAAENYDPGTAYPLEESSEGEYAAVACLDYEQLYDMTAPPAARRRQFRDAIDELSSEAPETFAPFTVDEWATSPASAFRDCVEWPAVEVDELVVDPDAPYPDVPTLLLSGELDSITTAAEAALVAAEMPDATFVTVDAATHVTALGDFFDCASVLVRRFVVEHEAGDTSCATDIAPLPRVAAFPRRVADAEPAAGPAPGDGQLVTVAVDAVSDALARLRELYVASSPGLRGGRVRTRRSGEVVLVGYRWTEDGAVTGTVTPTDDPQLGQGAAVEVRVRVDDGTTGRLRWTFGDLGQPVEVTGDIDGRPVTAVARTA
jgi:hypothetical protein